MPLFFLYVLVTYKYDFVKMSSIYIFIKVLFTSKSLCINDIRNLLKIVLLSAIIKAFFLIILICRILKLIRIKNGLFLYPQNIY